jgi:glutamate-ammonia-ligase adenylyltransferase
MDFLDALRFSRYATAVLDRHPDEAQRLAAIVDQPFVWDAADAELAQLATVDADALAAGLRRLRSRVLVHTLVRDLTGRADLAEVCGAVTRLADSAVRTAVTAHHRRLAEVHGEPRDVDGIAQELIVVGMGKLGGAELNVSSDVDLVFVYPEEGETDGAKPLSNREFFERLGRRVIGALNDVTAEGFVFRVDMRLRPYGDSGPLAVPFSALERYLVPRDLVVEHFHGASSLRLLVDALVHAPHAAVGDDAA